MVAEKIFYNQYVNFNYGERVETPFTKCAYICGLPVDLDGIILVPAFGIPYGCKLTSPMVFEYDERDEKFYLRSFVAISEDVGMELRYNSILDIDDKLICFVTSNFPVYALFYSVSYDHGITWSEPKYTGIDGSHVVAVSRDNEIVLGVKNSDKVIVYSGRDVELLRPVGVKSIGFIDVDYTSTLKYIERAILEDMV